MKFKTPPMNAKVIATLPAMVSVAIAAVLVWQFRLEQLTIPLVLGIIAGGLSDLDNRLTGRLKNLFFMLLAFAVSSLAVQFTLGDAWRFIATVTVLAFIFTVSGAVSLRYRTIAFGTLAVAVYTTLTYKPDMVWYVNPAMILCGAVLYSVNALLIHVLFPHRPVQESVANAYVALGAYLDAKACFFDPDEVGWLEQRQIDLAMRNNQVVTMFNVCRSALFYRMRGQHRHPRTSRMLRHYFVAQDIHERASSSYVQYQAMAEKLKHTDLIFRALRLLELQGQACRQVASALREGKSYEYDARLARAGKGLQQSVMLYAQAHPDDEDVHFLQRVAANLQGVNYQLAHLNRQWEDEPDTDWRIAHHESHGLRDAWRNLRSQLNFESSTFRHAVRMAVLVLACGLIVEGLQLEFGYWILLTAVFVCQPNYSATQSRLKQRVVGTFAGVVVGSLLPYFTPSLEAKLMILVASVTLFFFFRANKYSYSTFFITIQALVSFSIAGMGSVDSLWLRLMDTVIGCGLSWVAVSFLWPDWHYLKLSQTGAKAIQSDAGYLRSILVQLQHGSVDDMAYRVARRIGHERAAALSSTLSDMSGEPEKYGNRLQDGFQLLKINYSLLGYISSLGAYRSQMRHDEYNQAFLTRYFVLAEQVCDLLEKMQGMNGHDFTREVETVLAQLEDLRAESLCDEQSHVLWQQLSMISRLLLPAYQALHGEEQAVSETMPQLV